jgi:thiol-disulfide isomerase/thioredoxin
VDGKTYSLKDFASSKILVVIFSCNHCPLADVYEKRIKQLVTAYRGRGVAVVVISGNDPQAVVAAEYGYGDLGDTFAEMKTRAKYRNLNYPYLYDGATQAVTLKYGATNTPQVFIFDKERVLQYEGRFDNNANELQATQHDAKDAIDALLAGKPVAVPVTTPVGCVTKWAAKIPSVEADWAKFNARPVSLDLVSADQLKVLRSNSGTGRLQLVYFWATWCGACIEQFPELETMVRMYAQRPIDIVTVSLDGPGEQSEILAYLQKQHAFNKNLLLDSDTTREAVRAFGTDWAGGAPYMVLIGTNGEVLFQTKGEFNVMDVRRAIVKHFVDDHYIGQHAYWNGTF